MAEKEHIHRFRSVYYGSAWEVECSICNKNVSDIYNEEEANEIVEQMLEDNKKCRKSNRFFK